jgi:hypothetical protein
MATMANPRIIVVMTKTVTGFILGLLTKSKKLKKISTRKPSIILKIRRKSSGEYILTPLLVLRRWLARGFTNNTTHLDNRPFVAYF